MKKITLFLIASTLLSFDHEPVTYQAGAQCSFITSGTFGPGTNYQLTQGFGKYQEYADGTAAIGATGRVQNWSGKSYTITSNDFPDVPCTILSLTPTKESFNWRVHVNAAGYAVCNCYFP